MTQERLTVRKIQDVLRLKWESRLSNRVVGRACNISCSTVSEYVQRAVRAGLSWPLPEGLSDEELYSMLFPETARSSLPSRDQSFSTAWISAPGPTSSRSARVKRPSRRPGPPRGRRAAGPRGVKD